MSQINNIPILYSLMPFIHVDNAEAVKKYNDLVKTMPTMVLYYAPWCGHCEQLKPFWMEFEARVRGKDTNILVARVQNEYMSEVEGDKDIMGFPTIYYLVDGKKQREFEGPRTTEGLLAFFKEVSKSQSGGKRRSKTVRKSLRRNKYRTRTARKSHKVERKVKKMKTRRNKKTRRG